MPNKDNPIVQDSQQLLNSRQDGHTQTDDETQKGIIAWFTHNSVAANLLMWIILVGGIASILTIEKQTFPKFVINSIQIQVAYPAAAALEVEQGILMPIEESLQGLDGIKKIRGTATEGLASLIVEVQSGYELQQLLDEINMRVGAIRTFPENIEQPQIYQMRFSDPVARIQVYGELNERELKELAIEFRPQVAAISGVGRAEIEATRAYEVAIEITDAKLQEYALDFDQVAQAVRNSSLDLPGGSIKAIDGNILLRTKAQAYDGNEFAEIVLRTNSDGSRITLADVAEIRDGFEERAGFSSFNGQQTVMINVFTAEGQNDIDVSAGVRDFVDQKNIELPQTVALAVWADRSFYLKDRLNLMLKNMAFGGFFVFIILALFLQLRLAFWVLVGMTVSFFGAMALMPVVDGLTINMLSLFGFILVLGIVVDDAIIIGESIYSEVERNGQSPSSVVIGAKRVAMPATFGVLTTICAFIPMVSIGGMMGAFWGSIGWIVILCLGFSLIESKWILPAHLAQMKAPTNESINSVKTFAPNLFERMRAQASGGLQSLCDNKYKPLLELSLTYRYNTMAIFFALMLVSAGLIKGGFVRWEFFPKLPSDFIQAEITMENGTNSQVTNATVKRVALALEQVDSDLQTSRQEDALTHYFSGSYTETTGVIIVELTKGESRETNSFEIVDQWRQAVGAIAGVKSINFSQMMGGPQQGKPVAFQLRGNNIEQLIAAATELKRKLAAFQGVYDIEDSYSDGNREILVALTANGESLGFTSSDVARQVRQAFYGAEAQRILRGTEEVKVMVRYPLASRRSVGDLQNMHLRSPSGVMVSFAEIATVEFVVGSPSITRIDQFRSVTVSADVDPTVIEAHQVIAEIKTKFEAEIAQKYPGVNFALEGMSQEEADSLTDLALAAFGALLGIYALLAIPLKSYSQPLVIMSVIPFGFIGALIGHLLLGLSFSILSVFGLVALSGVVVNDSLIMVDFVNRARDRGLDIKLAALQAGTQRFRAIILTSATTFFGLLPIVLERSLQAQIVIPMAISLAFGILFATVITLILIPCLYLMLDDLHRFFGKLNTKSKHSKAA
jgi:multidrug efflux pump subunit AcrB